MKTGDFINILTYAYMNHGDIDVAIYKDGKIFTNIDTMYDDKSSVFIISYEEKELQNV